MSGSGVQRVRKDSFDIVSKGELGTIGDQRAMIKGNSSSQNRKGNQTKATTSKHLENQDFSHEPKFMGNQTHGVNPEKNNQVKIVTKIAS